MDKTFKKQLAAKNNREHLASAQLVIETIDLLEAELDSSNFTNIEKTEKFKTIQGLYKSLKYHVNKQLEKDKAACYKK